MYSTLQVPVTNSNMEIQDNFKAFQHLLPVLTLFGEQVIVGEEPYDVDEEVQLVCKYLKAFDTIKPNGERMIDTLYKDPGV